MYLLTRKNKGGGAGRGGVSDARHAKQPQTQPDNQSINEKPKTKQNKKLKSVFIPASVRLSKNSTREKKWSSK